MKTLFTLAKRTGSSSPAWPEAPPLLDNSLCQRGWDLETDWSGQSSLHWLLLAANILVGERSLAFAMMTTGSLSCSVFVCDFFIISSAKSALRARFRTIRANPSLFCLTHHFSPFCPSPPPFPPHFALSGAFSCGSPKTRLEEGTPPGPHNPTGGEDYPK